MIKVILIVIVAEIWTAAGHVLFKKGTNSLEVHSLRGASGMMRFVKNVLAHPSIWLGLAAMAIGMVVWLLALVHADLSIVFSLGSIQYILVLFLAHFFLGEKIDAMKFIGTFLVMLGIILITIS